ncbi:hypothetical protein BH10PLA2_BH10PLA2_22550 [soil metagenome]
MRIGSELCSHAGYAPILAGIQGWGLENGPAVRIGYRVYQARGLDELSIPDVPRLCEYGIEILVVSAHLI